MFLRILVGITCFWMLYHENVLGQAFVPSQIPPADRAFLERQFKSLFTQEFGYTLVGAKPVSLCDFQDFELSEDVAKREKLITYLIQIFKDSPSFIFACPKQRDDEYTEVALVNIKAVRRIFQEEKNYFLLEAGFESAEDIISRAKNAEDIRDLFGKSSITTGILLGYGRSNAELFVRRCRVGEHLSRWPLVSIAPLPPESMFTPLMQKWLSNRNRIEVPYALPPLVPDSPFATLEEEWEWIAEVTAAINDPDTPPYLISTPGFVYGKSAETDRVLQKLNQGKVQIGELFSNGKYLEPVLKVIYSP